MCYIYIYLSNKKKKYVENQLAYQDFERKFPSNFDDFSAKYFSNLFNHSLPQTYIHTNIHKCSCMPSAMRPQCNESVVVR